MENNNEERKSVNVYIDNIITGWVDDQRLSNGFGTAGGWSGGMATVILRG